MSVEIRVNNFYRPNPLIIKLMLMRLRQTIQNDFPFKHQRALEAAVIIVLQLELNHYEYFYHSAEKKVLATLASLLGASVSQAFQPLLEMAVEAIYSWISLVRLLNISRNFTIKAEAFIRIKPKGCILTLYR